MIGNNFDKSKKLCKYIKESASRVVVFLFNPSFILVIFSSWSGHAMEITTMFFNRKLYLNCTAIAHIQDRCCTNRNLHDLIWPATKFDRLRIHYCKWKCFPEQTELNEWKKITEIRKTQIKSLSIYTVYTLQNTAFHLKNSHWLQI